MKSVEELNLGYSDAQNYQQKKNKEMFDAIFVKNFFLNEVVQPTKYFLIGEKGTGKTAYAVYLANREYKDCVSSLSFIRSTDYEMFHRLKIGHHLQLSDYKDVWVVIISLLLSTFIVKNPKIIKPSLGSQTTISQLKKLIEEYQQNAMNPEITNTIRVVSDADVSARIFSEHVEGGFSRSETEEKKERAWQRSLYDLARGFQNIFSKIKLNKNVCLFIDGIDVRPDNFPYSDYLECIKGLETASWLLNTTTFANVKDSRFQFKVVLLLRPDIFAELNLQNATSKLRDNAVYLNWNTTYADYRSSQLYLLSNKLLSFGQEAGDEHLWDRYFDWKIRTTSTDRQYDTAFMAFLRISLSRPRDIQVILSQLQKDMISKNLGSRTSFDLEVFESDGFQNAYSEYFMGSLKDQLSFYISTNYFSSVKRFFGLFADASFTYGEYKENYEEFINNLREKTEDIPDAFRNENSFLQLLYNCNMITAIENKGDFTYFHFSYREKSISNINPEVPVGPNTSYRFHYGLYKKTNRGRY